MDGPRPAGDEPAPTLSVAAPGSSARSGASGSSVESLRGSIGPALSQVIRLSRHLVAVVRAVLAAVLGVLTLLGLASAGLLAASGRVYWWLAFGLFVVWFVVAAYAVRRVARLVAALDARASFETQFFQALDLTGAASKAQALLQAVRGGAKDGSKHADRSALRLLLHFFSMARVPGASLERVKELPAVAPFLPGSLAWSRLWLVIAAALSVACPALAVAAAAAGFGPA